MNTAEHHEISKPMSDRSEGLPLHRSDGSFCAGGTEDGRSDRGGAPSGVDR
jgi:hypothetical protein